MFEGLFVGCERWLVLLPLVVGAGRGRVLTLLFLVVGAGRLLMLPAGASGSVFEGRLLVGCERWLVMLPLVVGTGRGRVLTLMVLVVGAGQLLVLLILEAPLVPEAAGTSGGAQTVDVEVGN